MRASVSGGCRGQPADPIEAMALAPLAALTPGRADVVVGLLDGPVDATHPQLVARNIRRLPGATMGCEASGDACAHGTFVAGVLNSTPESPAPGVCAGCTLLVRPIFGESAPPGGPAVAPRELGTGIADCVESGAWLVNISAALTGPALDCQRDLAHALELAAHKGVLVIAAAGNQAQVGGSPVTRHPWVLPVVAYGRNGRPLPGSSLGSSLGRRGLGAPGEAVTSLAPGGGLRVGSGTSAATPFVSGAAALLWSRFPDASALAVRSALIASVGAPRRRIVPPVIDAWRAHQELAATFGRRGS